MRVRLSDCQDYPTWYLESSPVQVWNEELKKSEPLILDGSKVTQMKGSRSVIEYNYLVRHGYSKADLIFKIYERIIDSIFTIVVKNDKGVIIPIKLNELTSFKGTLIQFIIKIINNKREIHNASKRSLGDIYDRLLQFQKTSKLKTYLQDNFDYDEIRYDETLDHLLVTRDVIYDNGKLVILPVRLKYPNEYKSFKKLIKSYINLSIAEQIGDSKIPFFQYRSSLELKVSSEMYRDLDFRYQNGLVEEGITVDVGNETYIDVNKYKIWKTVN